MEVKIGIQSVQRELVVETDTPAEEIERSLSAALEKGDHAVFALSMAKGGRVLVPADKIAYVEFGGPEARRVGFGNIALRPRLIGVSSASQRLLGGFSPASHRPGLTKSRGLSWYRG